MSRPPARYAAVDLGASSGRVMVAAVGPDRLELTEVHRFANEPVEVPGPPVAAGAEEETGALHWDVLRLWHETVAGLGLAAGGDGVAGIGVDGWAVDYALLDARGELLGNPRHYRDVRTRSAAEAVHRAIPRPELYRLNGLQHLPFTTLFQLAAARGTAALGAARSMLLLPDLFATWLGGRPGTELTNASTTGLLDVRTGDFSDRLVAAAGIDRSLLGTLHRPGDELGRLRPGLARRTGLSERTVITAVGSHDTASAVVAVPADTDHFAYISCGTWALVGIETAEPLLSERSRAANFTNEAGVDGRVRYLRNVMGLWVLQEALRTWRARGRVVPLPAVLEAAADRRPGPVVDLDHPSFLPPGDMPARVRSACARLGVESPDPDDEPGVVRCILDSLAAAFARTVDEAAQLSGQPVDVIHLVGGGALNGLLCRLTAEAAARPVVAGPVEATALGNVLVQARAAGTITGDLADLRTLVRRTQAVVTYPPRGRPRS